MSSREASSIQAGKGYIKMNVTEKTKIGMCCQCGGTFSKKETVIVDGFEVCKGCLSEVEEYEEPDHDEGGSGAWGDPFNQR